ncbi:hypothetical protein [Virgibacillus oceani]|uniref:Uncharacterized protein n=1 Tax=Virgibacillus oceani TaxID=1479511 RepID=A0A917HBJ4_9BACI|nr:hypothetical protein [Virgibacillus oceani]GGG73978.1 hypothetical protein GCM10011398_18170 [Virgibacillus oceani]
MWTKYLGGLDDILVLICTVLAFLIPLIIYKVNRKFHGFGDPPWKEKEKGVDET